MESAAINTTVGNLKSGIASTRVSVIVGFRY